MKRPYTIHLINKNGIEESVVNRWNRQRALMFGVIGLGMDFHHVIVKTPGGKILYERDGENIIKDIIGG